MLAWISVHDHVVGGKLRGLAKDMGCSQKEALGILVSLWLWGLNNADRTGELKSCDREDVADELSKGLSDGLNPTSIVASLIEQSWIDEEEDGSLYLHDWDVWQEQWYKFLSTKEYDAKRKREARAKKKAESSGDALPPVNEGTGAEQDVKTNAEPDVPTEVPVESPQDSPEDKQPVEDKKPKKAPRKKAEKKQYADYVTLAESEYEKLVEGHGKAAADKFVEELNLYKGSTGKTYQSDYMTILNWVVDKVEKKYPGIIRRTAPDQKRAEEKPKGSNPFGQWKE